MHVKSRKTGSSGASVFKGHCETEFAVQPTEDSDVFGIDCFVLKDNQEEGHVKNAVIVPHTEYRVQVKTTANKNGFYPRISTSALKHLMKVPFPTFVVIIEKPRHKMKRVGVFYVGRKFIDFAMKQIDAVILDGRTLSGTDKISIPSELGQVYGEHELYSDNFSFAEVFKSLATDFSEPYGLNKVAYANATGMEDHRMTFQIPGELLNDFMSGKQITLPPNDVKNSITRFGKTREDVWRSEPLKVKKEYSQGAIIIESDFEKVIFPNVKMNGTYDSLRKLTGTDLRAGGLAISMIGQNANLRLDTSIAAGFEELIRTFKTLVLLGSRKCRIRFDFPDLKDDFPLSVPQSDMSSLRKNRHLLAFIQALKQSADDANQPSSVTFTSSQLLTTYEPNLFLFDAINAIGCAIVKRDKARKIGDDVAIAMKGKLASFYYALVYNFRILDIEDDGQLTFLKVEGRQTTTARSNVTSDKLEHDRFLSSVDLDNPLLNHVYFFDEETFDQLREGDVNRR